MDRGRDHPADERFEVLGWPPAGPALRLDYRQFSYAGKFVMTTTGKAVVRAVGSRDDGRATDGPPGGGDFEDDVLAAVAFDEDRTDPGCLVLRYVTVRADRRGEGLGPRLAAFVATRACERGYDRLRIAVNNPFAYQALYKAGFVYTDAESGLAELLLERPCGTRPDRDASTYQAGLDVFRARGLGDPEAGFLDAKAGQDPPPVVDPPGDPRG
jgi:GNAT superfamily N-acetyltransferase